MSPSASHITPPHIQIPQVVVTNTLIVTNLDRRTFLPENLAELRSRLEQYGIIYKIVPIKSFNRILAIFYQTNDAKIAKTYCDRTKFLDNDVRIYYGQHTSIYDDEEDNNSKHLNVPALEKNWLISPPCSPPVGWTQIKEDGPNSNTLADDLVHALAHASLNNNIIDYYKNNDDVADFSLDTNMNVDDISRMQSPLLTVASCDSDSHQSDVNVPLILIQDWDNSGSQDTKMTKDSKLIQQTKAQLYPTLMRRPPTPDSRSQIIQTPRPPLLFS